MSTYDSYEEEDNECEQPDRGSFRPDCVVSYSFEPLAGSSETPSDVEPTAANTTITSADRIGNTNW